MTIVELQQLRIERKRERDRQAETRREKRIRPPSRHPRKIEKGIIAIDGEGESDEDGKHRYTLLAASTGQYIESHDLSSRACFEFLTALPSDGVIVAFSFNYDVAMMLRDVPEESCRELWQGSAIQFYEFIIQYTPSREFKISNRNTSRSFLCYDVFGFYQTSFVRALAEWKVGDADIVAEITEMKNLRGTFDVDMQNRVREYCLLECRLLVELVEKLKDAMDYAEIPISKWYGAGAVAAGLMKRENVKQYIVAAPEPFKDAILGSYFGGRFELAESGFHHNIHVYDIRSAYPYQIQSLPCLKHLQYRQTNTFDITASYALWFVSWNVARDCRWPPFPFRTDSKIIYPYRGSGWYHHAEVYAALETFGDAITVHHGIVMEPQCDHMPFAFAPDLYSYRAELKRAGNQAQLSLKLGLNSLYGKTAQGIGKGERKPPYQSYLWAGMITAGTRAMLTNAIRHYHDDIIEIATDSICSKVPLSLPISEQLGAWEYNTYDESFSVQPGIYDLVKNGEHKTRSRGFGKSEANWDEIKEAYLNDPLLGIYKYSVVRFMGLGGALQSTQFSAVFRRWIEHERTINFCPAKRIPLPFARGISPELYATDVGYRRLVLADFDGSVTLLPPDAPAFQPVSRAYQPRQSWADSWSLWNADPETALDLEQP